MVLEWALRGLERVAGRAKVAPHLETGLVGEREALFHLWRVGYTVVARRWTSGRVRGDLDLVAWRGGTLCFVEVKSRTARDAVTAETAVDRGKRTQMRRLARAYLGGFGEAERAKVQTRFDVISVYLLESGAECEVMEGAFGWSEG